MAKRTSPRDAELIDEADDLEHLVLDKRAHWRATGAKARRRQRRYKQLLLQQIARRGAVSSEDADDFTD